jgi:formamidopyrimidine-DNA glycosylase
LQGGSGEAGVRRTHPIRGSFGSDDVSHFFTFTCNLHLLPLAESGPPGRRRQRGFLMPELPEVETIVNELKPLVEGRTLQSIKIYEIRSIEGSHKAFTAASKNKKIIRVFRRGKYICFCLENGFHLTIHLRMTGKLLQKPGKTDKKYLRAKFVFREKFSLYFVDMRIFGKIKLWSEGEPLLPKLGPEPLNTQTVFRVLKSLQTKRFIKTLLLDQHVLAGIGNIYADEALFLAGIHPQAQLFQIKEAVIKRLSRELPVLLKQAVKNKGTTLSDYQTPDSRMGNHQNSLRVYAREGLPCYTCGTVITRIKINGRSSHFCPKCQPRT